MNKNQKMAAKTETIEMHHGEICKALRLLGALPSPGSPDEITLIRKFVLDPLERRIASGQIEKVAGTSLYRLTA